jgi:phosphocarrier protein
MKQTNEANKVPRPNSNSALGRPYGTQQVSSSYAAQREIMLRKQGKDATPAPNSVKRDNIHLGDVVRANPAHLAETQIHRRNGGYSVDIEILNELGIHARPASLFVKTTSKYDCEVDVQYKGRTVSGKSMIGLMTLEANHGARLEVHATGFDAEKCLRELAGLAQAKFYES